MKKEVIIVRISGGLGNQLFQYAMGRALTLRNNMEMKLDISFYSKFAPGTTPRKHLLLFFNIIGGIATETDFKNINIPNAIDQSLLGKIKRSFFRYCENSKPIYLKKIITEPSYSFCPDILKINKSCYLSGVWQSEKYFSDFSDEIKKEITLKDKLSSEAEKWISKISKCNSISIHIRRGDYANDKKTNDLHGICDIEYYKEAIKTVSNKIEKPEFFVFSDDIKWAVDNLKIKPPCYFVSDKNISDPEELTIMSKCKHNILANSSFSWWGAWLNSNPNKIVTAPQKWFALNNIETKDLIPKNWISL